MIRSIFIVLVTISASFGPQNPGIAQVLNDSPREVINRVDTLVISTRLPRYIFRFTSRPKSLNENAEYPDIDVITIRTERDTTLIQTVVDSSDGIYGFSAVDVNFDGYSDLQLDHNPLQQLNKWSTFYLFDTTSRTFEYSEVFSQLGATPAGDSLLVKSVYRGMHGDENWNYKVRGGKPLLIKHELNSDEVFLTEELINGQMTVLEQTNYGLEFDSAGQRYRRVIHEEQIDSVLRTTKKELLRAPQSGEPTQRQKKYGLFNGDFRGSYLLQQEMTYKYGIDKKGRKYRDVVKRDVVKDKPKVTRKYREYLNRTQGSFQ